jgi:DNA-binding NarL/FixJ family response regulator
MHYASLDEISLVSDTGLDAASAAISAEEPGFGRPVNASDLRRASYLLAEVIRIMIDVGILESFAEREIRSIFSSINFASISARGSVRPLLQVLLMRLTTESVVPSAEPEGPMSVRERSVLKLIARGLSNKQIARDLNIAPETVKSHAKHIFCKLGTSTRAEAAASAVRLGLL